MDFQDFKKKSEQQSVDELLAHVRFDIGKHKSKKLKIALGALARRTLLDNDIRSTHARRLEKQFNRRWYSLTQDEALERLRFWTVLDSLVCLDEAKIEQSVSGMKIRLAAVCEKVRGIEVIGACEIEVINIDKMIQLADHADEARKLNTLLEMIPAEERTLFKKGISSFALIHFHGIVDLQGFTEQKEQSLIKLSKPSWSEPYAVELKKLYSTNTMRTNFSRLARYLVKGGNENLMYKIGYGYDTEDAMNRQMIKSGATKGVADFEGFENEMSLTIREIEILGKSIYAMMSSSGSNMKNGYLFRHGYQKRW